MNSGRTSTPGVSIQEGRPDDSAFSKEVVARLALRSGSFGRYTLEDEIARGGMGTVLRVWDEDLQRWLAMKLIRARRRAGPEQPGAVGSRALGRFLEEAQVTGQLDHPGIVPVHELGLDAEGRVYFTMKLVEGQTLQAVFDELSRGEGGWTQTRVLGLLLRVCEAMSYAHDKGVIHRDLKPANVMVGRFGEVYVMDWGLARVLGREDKKDIRLRPSEPDGPQADTPSHESPLLTMDGDVVGTPAYMPPEQARGEVERLDERADVYALGAMLYQLLGGRVPHVRPGERPSWHALVARVLKGPPLPLSELAPRAPAELVAICEKAMAREAHLRYLDTSALAEDLSAFVEGRVVHAYETGAWAEARKWVQRNRPLAAALAAALVLAAGGLAGIGYVQSQGRKVAEQERSVAQQERERANQEAEEAAENERLARAETAKVLRLSDVKVLQELEDEAGELWPAHPKEIGELESWLTRALALAGNMAGHRATLAEMRIKALPWTAEERARDLETHPRAAELAEKQAELEGLITKFERGLQGEAQKAADDRLVVLEPEIGALREEVEARQTWRFESPEEEWQHDVLAELIHGLNRLESGLLAKHAMTADHGWSMPTRLSFARSLEAGFDAGGEFAQLWEQALPAIREAYPGLDLSPQMGLLPIGPDPASGLWEFAHLMTGAPAERSGDGKLILTEETGVVLVLLPEDTFLMGAQSSDPNGPNFDPAATPYEGPVHSVSLSPYFLSKFEMTQSQWQRLSGSNPSLYKGSYEGLTLLHPVEQVTLDDCLRVLSRGALTLPSEAQWEFAARGGTSTPWWTGSEPRSLADPPVDNLADRTAADSVEPLERYEDWLDDGHADHSPVGSFAANPFGFHDVHGNVWEWCLDGFDAGFYARSPELNPVCQGNADSPRMVRGGCYLSLASQSGSAIRTNGPASSADAALGVRPARPIAP